MNPRREFQTLGDGVGRMLALQVSKGMMTLEQLDQPSPGHEAVEKSRTDSRNPCDYTNEKQRVPYYNAEGEATWTYPRPTMEYPPATPFRNLAREWISANPREWALMNGSDDVRVQASPDPKDFAAVLPPSNPPTEAPKNPITLETNDSWCPF